MLVLLNVVYRKKFNSQLKRVDSVYNFNTNKITRVHFVFLYSEIEKQIHYFARNLSDIIR